MSKVEPITVYSYRRCPFAMRVRFVLHEKGIAFNVVEEKLSDFSQELRKMHPEAKVPVLVHGHRVLYESAIITEYIDDVFPEPRFMPDDPGARAEVRLWTYWCNHIFKPDIDRYKYGPSRLSEMEVNDAKLRLLDHLKKINTKLLASPYLVAEHATLADIHLFPFVRQLFKVQPQHPFFKERSALLDWLEGFLCRPSFEQTMKKAK